MRGGVRTIAAIVGVFALFLLSVLLWESYEQSTRRSFLREGAASTPTSVVDRGPIPAVLRESSGLAVSRAYPGVYWSHNDSGDRPRLYALDDTVGLVATVDVAGAEALDWEDMDIGPCLGAAAAPGDEADDWCIYLADTGDNARRRRAVTVYVVPEPDPYSAEPGGEAVAAVHFDYRDGPFDAEALAVTAVGDLVVATKGRTGDMWVFEIPSADVSRVAADGDTLTLTNGKRLAIDRDVTVGRSLTGGSIDFGGSILALRTYTEVYFYEWPIIDAPVPSAPVCFLGSLEPGGEAIAFLRDGHILLTSESPGSRVGHVLEIECAGLPEGAAR